MARVTGLDRAGIEVACAVRPRGHVLQVCNGKGLLWEDARRSALGEAAELHAAEHPARGPDAICAARELREAFWRLRDCGSAGWLVAPKLATDDVRCAWTRGRELFSGAEILVPSQALFCAPGSSSDLGPIALAWASNGTGAHPSRERALAHALLEACERELLVRALPDGWTPQVLLNRRLTAESLERVAPDASRLCELLDAQSFEAALFDLTPDDGLGAPLAGALLVDREEGPVPIAAGYACRLSPAQALLSALLEAAQSRLTDIHGAREDVGPMATQDAAVLRGTLLSAGATRDAVAMEAKEAMGRAPRRSKSLRPSLSAVETLLGRLRDAGVDRVGVFDLGGGALPVHVMRVVVPGFRISELLV